MAFTEMDFEAMKLTARLYEAKLKELMTQVEFKTFSTEVAKKVFKNGVQNMPNGDFKNFCLDNFDKITSDETE